MKKNAFSISIYFFVLVAVLFCFPAVQELAAKDKFPPEMEKWLKASKLGPYGESPQDWAKILFFARNHSYSLCVILPFL